MAGISCSLCLLPPQTLCADVGDTRLMARMKFAAQSSDVHGRHVFSVSESPACQNLMYQCIKHRGTRLPWCTCPRTRMMRQETWHLASGCFTNWKMPKAKAAITEAIKLSRADDDMRGFGARDQNVVQCWQGTPVSRTVKYIFLAMDIWVTSLTAMDPEDWEQLSAQRGCSRCILDAG